MIEVSCNEENVHGRPRMVVTLDEAAPARHVRDHVSRREVDGDGRGVNEGGRLGQGRRNASRPSRLRNNPAIRDATPRAQCATRGGRRRQNALRAKRGRRRTTGRRGKIDNEERCKGRLRECDSRQQRPRPVEFETHSCFKIDRSVTQITMTGSIEKCCKSAAKDKIVMV